MHRTTGLRFLGRLVAPALVLAALLLVLQACGRPPTPPPGATQHELQLDVSGGGSVLVTADGASRTCSGPCTLAYDEGTVVTLEARAGSGTGFAGWSGDCDGAALRCTLTLDADRSAGASFATRVLRVVFAGDAPRHATLSPDASGTGSRTCTDTCAVVYPSTLRVSISLTLDDTPVGTSTVQPWEGCDASAYGNRFCTITVDGPKTVTITALHPPVGSDDAYSTDEDTALSMGASAGVLANDGDTTGDTLHPLLVDGEDVQHGSLTLEDDGSFTYTPAADYHGPDGFRYYAVDAYGNRSDPVTVALTVRSVNDAPVFTLAGDPPTVKDAAGPQTVANFATGIGAGGSGTESGQALAFELTQTGSTGTLAFVTPPALATDGTLTYTPTPGTFGTATYQVVLHDDGGTANGGKDTSPPQTFTLTVRPLVLTLTLNGAGSATLDPPPTPFGESGTEGYASGTTVTITAVPTPGSDLQSWGGACTGKPNQDTCDVTMNDDLTVSVNFVAVETLAVATAGNGAGTVTSDPSGIACTSGSAAGCSTEFVAASTVTLTATAKTGSTFTGWSGGGCSGTGTCQVTMDALTTVTATFTLDTEALTVSTTGGNGDGNVGSNPGGITCGPGDSNDCSEGYDYGTLVTLTATAATGSTFTGWSGGGCSGTGTCQVTMNAAKNVTAAFTLRTFQIAVSTTGGSGDGGVASSPGGIACGANDTNVCSFGFAYGTSVTLTAAAATGSTFTSWTNCPVPSGGTCTFTVTADRTVTAGFTLQTRTLTVSIGGAGGGSVTSEPAGISCTELTTPCSDEVPYGTTVTLTAAPDSGSNNPTWTGCLSETPTTCTVSMTANRNVEALFGLQTRTLNVTVAGTGSGSVSSTPSGIACGTSGSACSAAFDYGTKVTLTGAPDAGSGFTGWSGACTGTGPCEVTMDSVKNVTATFDASATPTANLEPSSSTCDGVAVAHDCEFRVALVRSASSYQGAQFDVRSDAFVVRSAAALAPTVSDACFAANGSATVILACDSAHRFGAGDILALTLTRTQPVAALVVLEHAFLAPDALTRVDVAGGSRQVN